MHRNFTGQREGRCALEGLTEIIVIHVIGHGRGWKEIIVMRGNFLVHWGGLQIRQNCALEDLTEIIVIHVIIQEWY